MLEIFNMKIPQPSPNQFDLKFLEFEMKEPLYCNFDRKGKLIIFGKGENKGDYKNFVYVYSIKAKAEFQKVFMIQREAKLISISRYGDKIWLRLDNDINEWNLRNGHTTIISKDRPEVKIKKKTFLIFKFKIDWSPELKHFFLKKF